jgi:hypothetical protein
MPRHRLAASIVVVTAFAAWLALVVESGAEQNLVAGPAFSVVAGRPTEPLRARSPDPRTTRNPNVDLPPGAGNHRTTLIDSGWVIASPHVKGPLAANERLILGTQSESPVRTSTIATGSSDPNQQIILHHVLEQGRTPLLQKPSPSQAVQSEQQSAVEVRFAVRPDGIEGWRSPGPVFAPSGPSRPATPSGQVTDDAASPNDGESSSNDGESSSNRPVDEDTVQSEPATSRATTKSFAEVLGELSSKSVTGSVTGQHVDTGKGDGVAPATEPDLEIAPFSESPSVPIPPPLSQQLIQLRSRVRSVLKGYYRRTLNSREHDPWEVMHGMLAYGVHSRVRQGGPRGEPITSVGWMCYNKPCKGQSMLYVTPRGELRAKYGVGLQGHLGQFLAMLAQCRVSADYPIHVGKNEFTIRDLIAAEKKTCYPKSELTFKLIALQYYLDLNHRWVNDQGQEWDIPRLIREELAQPIRGAACGGTHRLSSLSLTVKSRLRRGEPLDGEYARAASFVQKYHKYAFGLQNRDGSLSTAWFRGRGDDPDIDRRIKTTGHILEWLCYSLSDEELREPPTVQAVSYLANLMYSKYDNDWEVGPMCHAIHALLLYDERVFQPFDGDDYDMVYKPRPRTATVTYPSRIRR